MRDDPGLLASLHGIVPRDTAVPTPCHRCGEPTLGRHRDACERCIAELYAERSGQWYLVGVLEGEHPESLGMANNAYPNEAAALAARPAVAARLGKTPVMLKARQYPLDGMRPPIGAPTRTRRGHR